MARLQDNRGFKGLLSCREREMLTQLLEKSSKTWKRHKSLFAAWKGENKGGILRIGRRWIQGASAGEARGDAGQANNGAKQNNTKAGNAEVQVHTKVQVHTARPGQLPHARCRYKTLRHGCTHPGFLWVCPRQGSLVGGIFFFEVSMGHLVTGLWSWARGANGTAYKASTQRWFYSSLEKQSIFFQSQKWLKIKIADVPCDFCLLRIC